MLVRRLARMERASMKVKPCPARENGHVFLQKSSLGWAGRVGGDPACSRPGVAANPQASEQLLPLIYDQLRRIAREYVCRERDGHTLQPTALVHEAYLKLTRGEPISWQGRVHFYSVVARAMRRILVNHARDRLLSTRDRLGRIRSFSGSRKMPLRRSTN